MVNIDNGYDTIMLFTMKELLSLYCLFYTRKYSTSFGIKIYTINYYYPILIGEGHVIRREILTLLSMECYKETYYSWKRFLCSTGLELVSYNEFCFIKRNALNISYSRIYERQNIHEYMAEYPCIYIVFLHRFLTEALDMYEQNIEHYNQKSMRFMEKFASVC